jgi:2-polyprenyl-3-methyl-5-hydroxy-6-metoxy-1,4-benzoquinol methylase
LVATTRPQVAGSSDPAVADCRGKRIGILIVTYNALTTLSSLLRRIPDLVWKNVAEVVVFDDASQDATYELALGLKTLSADKKLHVLKHERNLGYGGNQMAGYRYFLERGFDVVVLLHGDGQYAPEMLADMYSPIIRGEADAVFGSRMMKEFGGPLKGGMPLYKYVGNRILTGFENASLGMQLTEFHSGYRAYSLPALREIDFSRMTNEFHFDTEIIIKLHHQGFRIKEVPIPTYYGNEICYVNGMKYARDVFRAVWRYEQTRRSIRRHPEYAEYFVHYPIKQGRNSSHQLLSEHVGSGKKVLDVGCGKGFLAEQLTAQDNKVSGVDYLPPNQILPAVAHYAQANLFDGFGSALEKLGGQYDRVVFLDVLEHLPTPEKLLQEAAAVLKEHGGQIIVSVPNIANITVRLMLLMGNFSYQERGILDRTHLRFYTRRTIVDLLESCGYEIVTRKMTILPLEIVFPLSVQNPLMRLLHSVLGIATRLMPGLLGYQTFLVARRRANQK